MSTKIKTNKTKNKADIGVSARSLNMIAKMAASIISPFRDRTEKWSEALYEQGFVVMTLLCTVLEAMGLNPLEECDLLLQYEVYLHGSMTSEEKGLYVEKGKVYDEDGDEVPGYKAFYEAREKGKSFVQVQNEWYKHESETDEHNGSGV